MTDTWKFVLAIVVVASAILLLSLAIFGSFIPGLILVVLAAVVARVTVRL